VRSLSTYDEFEFDELHQFLDISRLNIDNTVTGNEPFPRITLTLTKSDVNLLKEIYELLVDYYNNAYELNFMSVTNLVRSEVNKRST